MCDTKGLYKSTGERGDLETVKCVRLTVRERDNMFCV